MALRKEIANRLVKAAQTPAQAIFWGIPIEIVVGRFPNMSLSSMQDWAQRAALGDEPPASAEIVAHITQDVLIPALQEMAGSKSRKVRSVGMRLGQELSLWKREQ